MKMIGTSRRYEYRILIIFFLTWGIVMMDRLAMSFLAPVVMPKLNMTNTDLGLVGFATSAVMLFPRSYLVMSRTGWVPGKNY